jgi:membrane dipeptidase
MGNQAWPIFDGHNDTLLQLYRPAEGKERSFFERSEHGHIDLPRAIEGGFGGGFFAVFVPPPPGSLPGPIASMMTQTKTGYEILPFPEVEYEYALQTAMDMTSILFRLEAESKGKLKVVRNASELSRCLRRGTIAAVLHFEGAEAIDPDLNELEVFYKAGLRSLGPVWSRPNAFAHGVPFKFPHTPDTGPGLTEAGVELVKACNRLGIMVDLAHINSRGFWDVAEITDAPLVVTHTAAHRLCPSTRNLTNDQLKAIKDTGGMVGLNFNVRDVRADGRTEFDTSLIDYVRHINYLVKQIGIDHVGFGSDFDGTNVSNKIKDATGLPKLIAALEEAGYDKNDLKKLTHKNWLRVLKRTWES